MVHSPHLKRRNVRRFEQLPRHHPAHIVGGEPMDSRTSNLPCSRKEINQPDKHHHRLKWIRIGRALFWSGQNRSTPSGSQRITNCIHTEGVAARRGSENESK